MSKLFDLTGRVALITGSTRGIGKAIAEEMARAGAKVVISSRKPEPCHQVCEAIKAEGGEAIAVPCNVGKKEDLMNLVDETLAAFGKIDILVCNAATNPVYGPTAELTDEAWDKIMDTNVKGTFWLCNRVLPEMDKNGGGNVVIISSIAGLRGNTVIGTYGVSKAAEAALARNLAVEWGRATSASTPSPPGWCARISPRHSPRIRNGASAPRNARRCGASANRWTSPG